MVRRPCHSQPGVVRRGVVEGREVEDILLDTGCSKTLIHKDLVPEGKIQQGEAVAIRCAHGITVLYPLTEISLKVAGCHITVEAAVSETLPMSVLLGTDVPELTELLVEQTSKRSEEAYAVTTRATFSMRERRNHEGQVASAESLEIMHQSGSTVWMEELDDELFEVSKVRTRKEKRAEKQKRRDLQVDVEEQEDGRNVEDEGIARHELDISSEELKVCQATDPSLGSVRIAVKTKKRTEFFYREGLLYRRWLPPGRNGKEMAVEQLVLPKSCRETVMRVAHCIPLAGHLGKNKTARRLLQRFYWPTITEMLRSFVGHVGHVRRQQGREFFGPP